MTNKKDLIQYMLFSQHWFEDLEDPKTIDRSLEWKNYFKSSPQEAWDARNDQGSYAHQIWLVINGRLQWPILHLSPGESPDTKAREKGPSQ